MVVILTVLFDLKMGATLALVVILSIALHSANNESFRAPTATVADPDGNSHSCNLDPSAIVGEVAGRLVGDSDCALRERLERNETKIAVYSANFGNYRSELRWWKRNRAEYDSQIDYYFFTENRKLKLKHWRMVYVELQGQLEFMDEKRHTAKFTKWVVPDVLKGYDVLIWIDTKSLNYLKFKKEKILRLSQDNIHMIKNPYRSSPLQEVEETVALGQENKKNAEKFKEEVKQIHWNSHLPDTTCIVYRMNLENENLLRNVYNMLLQYEFRRDQNVVQYAFSKTNSESKLQFFKWDDLNNRSLCVSNLLCSSQLSLSIALILFGFLRFWALISTDASVRSTLVSAAPRPD